MLIIKTFFHGILLAHRKHTVMEGRAMGQHSKKFIVIGAMDGVPSEAITMALRERGCEVIFSINQFFV